MSFKCQLEVNNFCRTIRAKYKPLRRDLGQRNITSPTPSDLTYTTRQEILSNLFYWCLASAPQLP